MLRILPKVKLKIKSSEKPKSYKYWNKTDNEIQVSQNKVKCKHLFCDDSSLPIQWRMLNIKRLKLIES